MSLLGAAARTAPTTPPHTSTALAPSSTTSSSTLSTPSLVTLDNQVLDWLDNARPRPMDHPCNATSGAGSWCASGTSGRRVVRQVAPITRPRDVTIIMVMQQTLPLAEIKAHLSEIVDRVEQEHDRVVLTRNGRAAAVIMSPEDLEALEDTLELLSDPAALKEIDRARQDVARGKVVSSEELRAKYLRR